MHSETEAAAERHLWHEMTGDGRALAAAIETFGAVWKVLLPEDALLALHQAAIQLRRHVGGAPSSTASPCVESVPHYSLTDVERGQYATHPGTGHTERRQPGRFVVTLNGVRQVGVVAANAERGWVMVFATDAAGDRIPDPRNRWGFRVKERRGRVEIGYRWP